MTSTTKRRFKDEFKREAVARGGANALRRMVAKSGK